MLADTFKNSSNTMKRHWLKLERLFIEVYLEPCQASMVELLLKPLTIFAKKFHDS